MRQPYLGKKEWLADEKKAKDKGGKVTKAADKKDKKKEKK